MQIWLSERWNFVFLRQPKSSSKMVIRAIRKDLCRRAACLPEELRLVELDEYPALAPRLQELFVFTFVRNPWTRALSAYSMFHQHFLYKCGPTYNWQPPSLLLRFCLFCPCLRPAAPRIGEHLRLHGARPGCPARQSLKAGYAWEAESAKWHEPVLLASYPHERTRRSHDFRTCCSHVDRRTAMLYARTCCTIERHRLGLVL